MNTGEMCPLVEAVELRQRYKLRFFLDESISFGTLGKRGRGLTEYLNVDVKLQSIMFSVFLLTCDLISEKKLI